MTDEVDDFLAHYGVKGMKWGVRKKRDAGAEVPIRKTEAYKQNQEQVMSVQANRMR